MPKGRGRCGGCRCVTAVLSPILYVDIYLVRAVVVELNAKTA